MIIKIKRKEHYLITQLENPKPRRREAESRAQRARARPTQKEKRKKKKKTPNWEVCGYVPLCVRQREVRAENRVRAMRQREPELSWDLWAWGEWESEGWGRVRHDDSEIEMREWLGLGLIFRTLLRTKMTYFI